MISKDLQPAFIKDLRKRSYLSQRQFGARLNVSGTYIGQVENGQCALSQDVYERILKEFPNLLNDKEGNEETITLDFFPDVYASCGNGNTVFDESSEKVPVPISYISNYSTHDRYVMVTARGNSMTPDIFDMDRVIIKQYTGSQIVDDRMYLFRYMDEIFIKKLCKNLDQVVVKSNNPDFPNRFIEGERLKDMFIIGEVVGLVRAYH